MQSNGVFEEYKRFDFSKRDYRTFANLINNAVKINMVFLIMVEYYVLQN